MFNPYNLPFHNSRQNQTYSGSSYYLQKEPDCYFSFIPNPVDHYSVETPLASPDVDYDPPTPLSDPTNPLLSTRPPSALLTHFIPMEASKLMQFQTEAAHGRRTSKRNVVPSAGSMMAAAMFGDASPLSLQSAVSSFGRSNSTDSESSNSSTTSPKVGSPNLGAAPVTCSRCHEQSFHGFSKYTSSGHYCRKCAVQLGVGG